MKNLVLSLIGMILILSSCSDHNGSIKDPVDLKNVILDKYSAEKMRIKIKNKNSIYISLSDFRFQKLSHKKKQEIATEIGEWLWKCRLRDLKPQLLVL